jgi:DNA polymerase-3 subunit delta'
LQRHFQDDATGIAQVFGLVRQCTQLLQETRQQIQDEFAAEFKKEETLYKQTTDSDWLDDRENYYKALTESRYILQRGLLVDALLKWWADALRQRQSCVQLDQPDYADDTAKLAQKFSVPQLLQRVAALEELRENFNRNVQEQLAIEAAFLKVF